MNTSQDEWNLGPLDLLYQGADQVLRHAQGFMPSQNLTDFAATVTWTEPFIVSLIVGQIMMFWLVYATRKFEAVQFGILLLITALTLAAERLNIYGSKNWSKIATQDYFDGPGLFMMVFVSGPFVLMANFIVITMGMQLVKMYARKMRREARQRHAQSALSTFSKKDS